MMIDQPGHRVGSSILPANVSGYTGPQEIKLGESAPAPQKELSTLDWTIIILGVLALVFAFGCSVNIAVPQNQAQQKAHDWIVAHI